MADTTPLKQTEVVDPSREISWFRYLYCNKLLKEQFESSLELPIENFVYWHNPPGFVYMMYFFGGLYTLIEGWKELALSDPVIDSILAHQAPLIDLLRRCRNAAFHYQADPLIPKLGQFLKTGERHIVLAHQLHEEFVRYYWSWVEKRHGTEEEKAQLKESLRRLVGWFPRTLKDDEREIRSNLASMMTELLREDISREAREKGIEAKNVCEVALVENRRASEELGRIRDRNLASLGVAVMAVDSGEAILGSL